MMSISMKVLFGAVLLNLLLGGCGSNSGPALSNNIELLQ